MQELLNEAKRLASEGVKELVLVAQETTLYGQRPDRRKTASVITS